MMSHIVLPAEPTRNMFSHSLVSEGFSVREGRLCVERVSLSSMADRFGTPLFVYSAESIRSACHRVRSVLPDGMEFYYSVKANPTAGIVRRVLEHCDGLEVASAGELDLALQCGCRPGKVLFAGPGKTDAELKLAVESGVSEIHVESLGEMQRLGRIAAEAQRLVEVSLRVNPAASVQGGSMRMGGRPTAFGIDEPQVPGVIEAILRQPWLSLCGLHMFAGTQNLDANVLVAQYRYAVQSARTMAEATKKPLKSIDFGGGWGVPMFPGETPLDIAIVQTGLQQIEQEVRSDRWLAEVRLMIEPGRYLVASSGVYLARVVDVKTSYGVRFAILDGGMNHHLAASGNLGQTIKRNFPLVAADRMDEPADQEMELAGPLCTPLDTLGRKWKGPQLEAGDLVAVLQSGAYGRSASPLQFLSHAAPPEVLVEGDSATLIRRRMEPEARMVETSTRF